MLFCFEGDENAETEKARLENDGLKFAGLENVLELEGLTGNACFSSKDQGKGGQLSIGIPILLK